jgi:hypothetical protein
MTCSRNTSDRDKAVGYKAVHIQSMLPIHFHTLPGSLTSRTGQSLTSAQSVTSEVIPQQANIILHQERPTNRE